MICAHFFLGAVGALDAVDMIPTLGTMFQQGGYKDVTNHLRVKAVGAL